MIARVQSEQRISPTQWGKYILVAYIILKKWTVCLFTINTKKHPLSKYGVFLTYNL